MKKLIMFLMVLAISVPVSATIDDPAPPMWGVAGTTGVWQLDDPCWSEPSCLEGTENYNLDVPDATWENGVLTTSSTELETLWCVIGVSEGGLYVTIHLQIAASEEIENATQTSLEIREAGPDGEFINETFPELVNEGGGVYTLSGTMSRPAGENLAAGCFIEANNMAVEGIIVDVITHDGETPPTGSARSTSCLVAPKPAIVVDPNIITIYEPRDPCEFGPEPPGPVVGNFGVKLGWRPGEDPCYPNDPCHYAAEFTVTVTLDPNTEGDKDHDDYKIWDGHSVDGTIQLVFDQNNFDVLQEVHIEAIKDLEREGNESYNLGFTSACNEDANFQDAEGTLSITVIDNDVRHVSALPDRITLSETDAGDPCGTEEIAVRLSHQPDHTVYALVYADEWAFEEEMFVIDPNFEDWTDPNRLTFTATTWGGGSCPEYNETTMTSCWDKPLTIEVHAKDNDWVSEPDVTNIPGLVVFVPYSEDLEYSVDWLEPDPYGFPIEVEDGDGEAEEKEVDVVVEDNDCGALGYGIADVAGGGEEGDEPDCVVNLADFAALYSQWFSCTDPFDADINQWGDCCAEWERNEVTGECPP
jgi:hypothetical protein